MAGWLTVDAYKAWARITDITDDPAISDAVAAVTAAVQLRAPRAFVDPAGQPAPPPDDVVQVGYLWVNRLLSRRNSPDGVVGVADMGTATIRSYDADIRTLLSPYTEMVVA